VFLQKFQIFFLKGLFGVMLPLALDLIDDAVQAETMW